MTSVHQAHEVVAEARTYSRTARNVRESLQSMPDYADIALANQIRRLTVAKYLFICIMSTINASASVGCVWAV